MNRVRDLLFPKAPGPMLSSALLLIARVTFGLLFLNHGLSKWIAFENIAMDFPDPLDIGSTMSLVLVIFAEVICSIGVILGVLFRLSLIPMIIAMGVALFSIHANDTFAAKEPALIFFSIFCLMFIWGPGYFSFDTALRGMSLDKNNNR
jgi:putative oxidoreductase